MNILVIGTTDNNGGAAKASWDIANGLRQRGHTVKFLVGYKNSKSNHVHQLPIFLNKKLTLYTRHLRSFLLANDQDFGQDQYIMSHPWYKEADIIHLHNCHGNFISLQGMQKISTQKPVVWTLHDMWAITSHCAYTSHAHHDHHDPLDCRISEYPPIAWDNRKKLWQKKLRILEKSNITFVSPSKWLQTKFTQVFSNHKIIHIPNGIDTQIFKPFNPTQARVELSLPINQPIALFVAQNGLQNTRKGGQYVKSLINISINPNHHLNYIIIGSSIRQTKENIHFRGIVSNSSELAKYFAAANMCIFPSIADNAPLTVLESLAVGTPVLAFDACGVSELITHKKNGYLAKYGDRTDLRAGIEYLLKHDSKFKKPPTSHQQVTKLYEQVFTQIYANHIQ